MQLFSIPDVSALEQYATILELLQAQRAAHLEQRTSASALEQTASHINQDAERTLEPQTYLTQIRLPDWDIRELRVAGFFYNGKLHLLNRHGGDDAAIYKLSDWRRMRRLRRAESLKEAEADSDSQINA